MITERLRTLTLVLEEAHQEFDASVLTVTVPRTIMHGKDTIEDLGLLRARADTLAQVMEELQATHLRLMQAVDHYHALSVQDTLPVLGTALTVHDGHVFAEAFRSGVPRTPDELAYQHRTLQKTQETKRETPALLRPLFTRSKEKVAECAGTKPKMPKMPKKVRTVLCGSLFGLQVRDQTPRVSSTEEFLGEQHFSVPLSPAMSRQHAKTLRDTRSPMQ